MARLLLVRHGEAAAGWGDDPDPGLSALGRSQAEATAARLASLGPLPILVSPLRRTRETAEPFAAAWPASPLSIVPALGEIGSPGLRLAEREAWLRTVLAGVWSEQDDERRAWRGRVIARLMAVARDTLVVTHFVAINVAVGAATMDDRVTPTFPANASVTTLTNDGGRLTLVETGAEGATRVL